MSHVERLRIPTDEEALLARRSSAAERTWSCLQSGKHGLEVLPGTIQEAIEIEAWRERESRNGNIWRLDSFRAWVTTAAPVGLGSSYDQICDMVSRNALVLALVRKAWGTELGEPGGAREGAGRCARGCRPTDRRGNARKSSSYYEL